MSEVSELEKAVDEFAEAMKARLRSKAKQGWCGWEGMGRRFDSCTSRHVLTRISVNTLPSGGGYKRYLLPIEFTTNLVYIKSMIKVTKIRIYPDTKQQEKLAKAFGCARLNFLVTRPNQCRTGRLMMKTLFNALGAIFWVACR